MSVGPIAERGHFISNDSEEVFENNSHSKRQDPSASLFRKYAQLSSEKTRITNHSIKILFILSLFHYQESLFRNLIFNYCRWSGKTFFYLIVTHHDIDLSSASEVGGCNIH